MDLFRPTEDTFFSVSTETNVPVAAGLASSACGFAALVLALNELFQWRLNKTELSILARLGSGSACRSLWPGFVHWQAGSDKSGMDSYAYPILQSWTDFRVGLLMLNTQQKPILSREAMRLTVETSAFYTVWPNQVQQDIIALKQAIDQQDFVLLGQSAESNALAMHATLQTAIPPIVYSTAETLAGMQRVWQLRASGMPVFFTQDAGPNLKLLFLKQDQARIAEIFPEVEMIAPFSDLEGL